MKRLLSCLALLSLSVFASAREGWETNFEKAKAEALAANKPLLLDFTGSDWCSWCMKLDKEVFSTPEWKEYASKNLVLVEVDFPQVTPQSDTLKRQNAKLQEKYQVEGFPTVVVLSPAGAKQGQLGYQPGGPAAFIAAVKKVK